MNTFKFVRFYFQKKFYQIKQTACGKKFKHQIYAQDHSRQKCGQPQYDFHLKCEHCTDDFSSFCDAETHLIKNHNIQKSDVEFENCTKWKCQECDELFYFETCVRHHCHAHSTKKNLRLVSKNNFFVMLKNVNLKTLKERVPNKNHILKNIAVHFQNSVRIVIGHSNKKKSQGQE